MTLSTVAYTITNNLSDKILLLFCTEQNCHPHQMPELSHHQTIIWVFTSFCPLHKCVLYMYIVDVQLILFFWFAFTVEVQLVYRHSTLNLTGNKMITQIEHNRIENPNWQEATSWKSIAKELMLGRPKTNSASQSRT